MITINVRETGSNYSEIPSGIIEVESLEAFLQKHDLTATETPNEYTTEWGNGEGVDTFEIEIVN